jgi:hypothetical protein
MRQVSVDDDAKGGAMLDILIQNGWVVNGILVIHDFKHTQVRPGSVLGL